MCWILKLFWLFFYCWKIFIQRFQCIPSPLNCHSMRYLKVSSCLALKIYEMEICRNPIIKNLWEMCMNQQSHILIWVIETYTIGTCIFLSNFKNKWALNRALSALYLQVVLSRMTFFYCNLSVIPQVLVQALALKFLSRYGSLYLLFYIMKSDMTFFI